MIRQWDDFWILALKWPLYVATFTLAGRWLRAHGGAAWWRALSAGTLRFMAGLVVIFPLWLFATKTNLPFWALYTVFAAARLLLWAAIATMHFKNAPRRELWVFSLLATLVNGGFDAFLFFTQLQNMSFC